MLKNKATAFYLKTGSLDDLFSTLNYETLFSVIPLKKGIQTRIGLIWIPACAGMTERRENDDLRVSRNSKFSMSSFF